MSLQLMCTAIYPISCSAPVIGSADNTQSSSPNVMAEQSSPVLGLKNTSSLFTSKSLIGFNIIRFNVSGGIFPISIVFLLIIIISFFLATLL